MLNKLNELRKGKEEGFTLIELLVVILIIGVLSAIALPIFLNQQKEAAKASVKSDVRNTVTNVATFLVSNPTAAVVDNAALTAAGQAVVASKGNTTTVSGSFDDYTVDGTSTAVTGWTYTFNSSGPNGGTYSEVQA